MSDSFPAGMRLGPYELLGLIGRGGGGEVYRARDSRLGRDVAVKTVRGPIDGDRLRRLELEARATAALNHPNIIAVYDVGVDADLVYVVTELLEGENLRGAIHHGPLDAATAFAYARQIADALAAAHRKGIVHRDLKPENIFVLPGGRIKLLDFGIAKVVAPEGADAETAAVLTLAGDVVGTPAYLAPEQARGFAVDHRADIFSFGVVLHEMLSGESPFRRDTSADTLSAILRDTPKPMSGNSPAIVDANRIIQRCLEKDPAARFQAATDLRFTLDGVAAATPRAPRRPRAMASVVVVAVMLGALAWGIVAFRDRVAARSPSANPESQVAAVTKTVPIAGPVDGAAIANVFPGSSIALKPVGTGELEISAPDEQRLANVISLVRMAEALRDHRFSDEPAIKGTAVSVAPLFSGGGQSKVRVSLSVHNASIKALVQLIAKSNGWPVLFDPSAKGNVTLDLRDVPWDGLVRTCLEFQGAGLAQSRVGDLWLISSKERAKEYVSDLLEVWIVRSRFEEPALPTMLYQARTEHGSLVENPRLGAVVIIDRVEAFSDYARILAAATGVDPFTIDFPRRSRQYSGAPVSVDFSGADAKSVFKTLSDVGGMNIILDLPSGTNLGTVDLSVRNVPWDNVFDLALFSTSTRATVQGNLLRVAPVSTDQAEKAVEVIPLKHDDGTLIGLFTPMLSAKGSITHASAGRAIIVNDTPRRVAVIKRLIRVIDDRTR